MSCELVIGDCREVMATMDASSVDAIVTDPPYGLSFMGKGWDHGVPGIEFWTEALRVAKPGAHLLAFGGTRTFHRLACAIEDAGWEIRDCLGWLYGSGFPKSLDVSKAIDKSAGVKGSSGPMKRGGERLARLKDGKRDGEGRWGNEVGRDPYTYLPATEAALQWSGWGTALKPAWEPIVMARKPLCGTVAANVLEHGTGAINVDGCRVGTEAVTINTWDDGAKPFGGGAGHQYTGRTVQGRWPANVLHDGSEDVDAVLGEAKRFFYCAKASKADRGPENRHPTVKPSALMAYLVRLVTPPGGIVLDPFAGSGTTGVACIREGFGCVLIEQDETYAATIQRRLDKENCK